MNLSKIFTIVIVLNCFLVYEATARTGSNDYVKLSLFSTIPPYLKFKPAHRHSSLPPDLGTKLLWPAGSGLRKNLHDGTLLASGITLVSAKRLSKSRNTPILGWLKNPMGKRYRHLTLQKFQKINSFPAMREVSYKDRMWFHFKTFLNKYPELKSRASFRIPTFVLPEEIQDFQKTWLSTENKLWINKLPSASMDRGNFLYCHWRDFISNDRTVAQKYIHNPALYNNRKLEFKYHFFVTSVHPLRVYSLPEFLEVRMSPSNYSNDIEKLHDLCIHSVGTDNCGREYMYGRTGPTSREYDTFLTEVNKKFCISELLKKLDEAVVLVLLSAENVLTKAFYKVAKNRYNFFNIISADFILDEDGKPWLMELNSSPVRNTAAPWLIERYQDYYSEVLNTVGYHFPRGSENLHRNSHTFINLTKLTFDDTVYQIQLTESERRKQDYFHEMDRGSYLTTILQNLTRDDVRMLMISEDELNRVKAAKRIFPSPLLHNYIRFIESSTYYYKLLDAWDSTYGQSRRKGRLLLEELGKILLDIQ